MTTNYNNGRRGPWVPAAAVFAVAAAVRLAHFLLTRNAIVLEPRGLLDDHFYFALARQLASGDLLARTGNLPFFLPPLYAYFLGAMFAMAGPGNFAPFLLQSLLGALAAAVVCRTAQKIASEAAGPGAGLIAGLTAGLLLALDGLAVLYSSTFLAASLDPILAAGFYYLIARAYQKSGMGTPFGKEDRNSGMGAACCAPTDWALAGVALGLFALNRPNALLLLPAAAALPFLRRPLVGSFNRRPALASAALLAAALLTLAPSAARNFAVSGRFTLISSHGGLNFYLGNRSGATGAYSAPDWLEADVRGQVDGTREWLSSELRRPVADAEVSGLFYRRAFDEIAADPAHMRGWLRLLAVKARLLLAGREAGLNLSLAYMREAFSPALWLAPVSMWLLVPFGLAGAVATRRWRAALVIAGLALVFAFSVWVFFISDRYRLPMHPPLAVLAGCGLAAVVETVKKWRGKSGDGIESASPSPRRELAQYLCVLAVAGVFAAWPTGVPSGDGQMRLMHALRLVEDGRIGEAETVEAGMPPEAMNPFFWRVKLARAYRARGANNEAEAEYRKLLEIDPARKEISCELGEMLRSQGSVDEADRLCPIRKDMKDGSGLK